MAVDIASRFREQEDRGVRNLLDFSPSTHGDALPGLLRRLLVRLGQPLHAFSVRDRTGRDDVARDAVRTVLDRHAVADLIHRRLRRHNVCLQRRALEVKRGRDENHPSPRAVRLDLAGVGVFLRALDQIRQTGFGRMIRPQRVNLHHCPERVRRQLRHGCQEIPRRARDGKIDASQLLRTSLRRLAQSHGVPHVHATLSDHFASLPCRRDVCRHSLRFLHIAPDDVCVAAQRHERAHLDRTDGAGSAGAEEHFVVEDAVAPDVGEVFFAGDGHGWMGGLWVKCMISTFQPPKKYKVNFSVYSLYGVSGELSSSSRYGL